MSEFGLCRENKQNEALQARVRAAQFIGFAQSIQCVANPEIAKLGGLAKSAMDGQ